MGNIFRTCDLLTAVHVSLSYYEVESLGIVANDVKYSVFEKWGIYPVLPSNI